MTPTEELLERVIWEEATALSEFTGESISVELARQVAERAEARTGIRLTEPGERYDFQFQRIVYALRMRAVRDGTILGAQR